MGLWLQTAKKSSPCVKSVVSYILWVTSRWRESQSVTLSATVLSQALRKQVDYIFFLYLLPFPLSARRIFSLFFSHIIFCDNIFHRTLRNWGNSFRGLNLTWRGSCSLERSCCSRYKLPTRVTFFKANCGWPYPISSIAIKCLYSATLGQSETVWGVI